MKNILLIGVGRFGRHIAMHLNQLGHQVMAVDRNEERIDAVMPYVHRSVTVSMQTFCDPLVWEIMMSVL